MIRIKRVYDSVSPAGGWAIAQQAREAASQPLHILPAQLKNDAGVVGAAVLAMRLFASKGEYRNV